MNFQHQFITFYYLILSHFRLISLHLFIFLSFCFVFFFLSLSLSLHFHVSLLSSSLDVVVCVYALRRRPCDWETMSMKLRGFYPKCVNIIINTKYQINNNRHTTITQNTYIRMHWTLSVFVCLRMNHINHAIPYHRVACFWTEKCKHRTSENGHCNGHVDDQNTKEEEVYQDLLHIQKASRPQVFRNLIFIHFFSSPSFTLLYVSLWIECLIDWITLICTFWIHLIYFARITRLSKSLWNLFGFPHSLHGENALRCQFQ